MQLCTVLCHAVLLSSLATAASDHMYLCVAFDTVLQEEKCMFKQVISETVQREVNRRHGGIIPLIVLQCCCFLSQYGTLFNRGVGSRGQRGVPGTRPLTSGTVSKRVPVRISMIQSVRNNTPGIAHSRRESIIYNPTLDVCIVVAFSHPVGLPLQLSDTNRSANHNVISKCNLRPDKLKS